MYSDEETEKPFQFKSWTPDITAKEKRNSKIQRIRLAAQTSLFLFGKGNLPSNASSQDDCSHNSETNVAPLRRISSCDVSNPTNRFEKYRKLAKERIFAEIEKETAVTLGTDDKKASVGTLNNSYTLKSLDCSEDAENKESLLNISSSKSSSEDQEDDEQEEVIIRPGNKEQRHSIFMNNIADEVEEMKEELLVEDDQDIYFIQGNFYSYYQEEEILGEGTSGTVKRCIRNGTGEVFAVKIVRYRGDTERLFANVREFRHHKKLNHKNIIKVYELYIDYFTKKTYLIMELAECEEMMETIQENGHYNEELASKIFKQILSGIKYLHLNGVCHRDLKPNNILVSKEGEILKITDFNVSKFADEKSKDYTAVSTQNYKMWTHTGTIAFSAPEIFDDSQYTEAVDMWSAGVLLYTMLSGYQPFQAENIQDLIEKIKEAKYDFDGEVWNDVSCQAKDLIRCLLDVNIKTRYSPFQALMHPWILNEGKAVNRPLQGVVVDIWSYLDGNQTENQESICSMNSIDPNMEIDQFEVDSRLMNDIEKTKTLYFSNLLSMKKFTFSSKQIEGKCLTGISPANENTTTKQPPKIPHFKTHDKLPHIFVVTDEQSKDNKLKI